MVKILIKKTSKEVITPKYKTDGSSGVDLSAFLEKIKSYNYRIIGPFNGNGMWRIW